MKTQKKLFVKFIELMVLNGYDISEYLFKPLNTFDFDKIKITIENFEKELN
jgi:hypothetical protein